MKKVLTTLCMVACFVFCGVIFSACTEKDVEIRVTGDYVQWSYKNENTWKDIISVQEIKDTLGETYKGDKGDKGDTGLKGDAGVNGKQVEFNTSATHVQWRYVGDTTWINLIAISEFGTTDENPQGLAFYLLDDGTYGVGIGNATQLSKITIPETYKGKAVTQIIDYGFYAGYYSSAQIQVVELSIPNSVTRIGTYAFYNCENLNKVTLPSSLVSIGDNAFYTQNLFEIYNLSNLQLTCGSESYGRIAQNAKVIHTSLSEPSIITEENNVLYLNWEDEKIAFGLSNYQTTSITIANDCTSIARYAFEDNSYLTSVVIPGSVQSIGFAAFVRCCNLTSVILNEGLKYIGNEAFEYTYLSYIVIPNSVVSQQSDFAPLISTKVYCMATSKPSTWNRGEDYYYYSETQPESAGNYWHYVNNEITIWE